MGHGSSRPCRRCSRTSASATPFPSIPSTASHGQKALGADRVVEMPAQMGGEDFSQFGLADVPSVLLHVGAVDAAKLAEAAKTGVPVPSVHSPLFAPVLEPTLKAAIFAETAILMELLRYR